MTSKLLINRLDRITLVQKSGGKLAKHPELRTGVVEVVKADEDDDWYADFEAFIQECPEEDIPGDWCLAFSRHVEKAGKKNYADSEGPFAGPHNSFPINSQKRVYSAARLLGHAADPAAVKAAIIRIARRKGYNLPKSWQSKVKKSDIVEAVKALLGWVDGDTSQVEEDEAPEADLEKAKKTSGMHSHTHAHVSAYGYSTYDHNHDHGHPDGVDADGDTHSTSEVAHAHAHISKAGDPVTEDEAKLLEADNAGLKADLEKAQASVTALEAKMAEASEKLASIEKALADEKVAKDAAVAKAAEVEQQLTEASRQPLTAAPSPLTKAGPTITPDMNFDDALKTLLHS